MPRASWKSAISFGLIYVPVELHTASKDNTLPLHMLDSRDYSAVGYPRVNLHSVVPTRSCQTRAAQQRPKSAPRIEHGEAAGAKHAGKFHRQ
jgi:non-homologous end joining protein Ku